MMGSDKKSGKINAPRRHRLYLLNILGMCAVTLISLAAAWYFLLQRTQLQTELTLAQEELETLSAQAQSLYTADEMEEAREEARQEGEENGRSQILMQIQSDMQSGTSTASMLRNLFSDDIVVVSGGKYYFYPLLETVGHNSFSSDDFTLTEDGRLSYSGTDEIRVINGIDVSGDSGDIDWEAVSEDDISFVMVEAGERLAADSDAASAGDLWDDETLSGNIEAASAAGLTVGVYWTLGAASAEEAGEEAEHLVDLLADNKSDITGYVAVRLSVPSETDRTAGQGRADWTEYVTIFCSTLEEAGYTPLIYGNLASFVMSLDLEDLETYGWARWVSNSGASLYFPYTFDMWQYSTEGTVQGISTEVSLNAMLIQE